MTKKENKLNINKIRNNFKSNISIFKVIHKNTKIIILSSLVLSLALFISFLFKGHLAASVNGRFITRTQLVKEMEKVDAGKTLDDLITKEIIFQEAKMNNIKIDGSVIDSEILNISNSLTSQGTTLENALSLQGLTMDNLIENIRIQKILEKILADNANITDEEISQRFEDSKTSYPENTKLEDVKAQIKDQLFQEKLTTAYQNWIAEKRSSYKIKIFSSLK